MKQAFFIGIILAKEKIGLLSSLPLQVLRLNQTFLVGDYIPYSMCSFEELLLHVKRIQIKFEAADIPLTENLLCVVPCQLFG